MEKPKLATLENTTTCTQTENHTRSEVEYDQKSSGTCKWLINTIEERASGGEYQNPECDPVRSGTTSNGIIIKSDIHPPIHPLRSQELLRKVDHNYMVNRCFQDGANNKQSLLPPPKEQNPWYPPSIWNKFQKPLRLIWVMTVEHCPHYANRIPSSAS